ncbi:hypothetical protein [Dyella sp.]|uniref:hypothetical protein n=1 Tax=Dyella sp. TaxID=1869338 RepID=UPI002B47453A|nr:hypothetical protein [Dyella sp.]HKT30220.1 hypothetical protein [Dyella sp.]
MLVEEVQWSMGERGRYYPTMRQQDLRMEACRRLLHYGDFVVLGRAFDRIVDIDSDASRPEHRRWVITGFGRTADNAHALLWHVEEIERRERARTAVRMLPPLMVTPDDQFNEDYANLWHWSVLNHRQAPPATASQSELDAYRNEQLRANSQEWHDYGVRRSEMIPTTVTMKEFNPKTDTLIVNSEAEAGRMLRGILGPSADGAISLNPSLDAGRVAYSTHPFANRDGISTSGMDVVGRILIADPEKFKSAVGAYGMYVQQQNGGYNSDSLHAAREAYLPEGFQTRVRAERTYVAVQGVLDLASLYTDVRKNYGDLSKIGQVMVYKDSESNKQYFEVIKNNANSGPSRVLSSDDYYQDIMMGMRDAK